MTTNMKSAIRKRAIEVAQYFIKNDTTVRETAKVFNSSKGTVHTDLIKRLPEIHPALYEKVRAKLEQNKSTRHMRGGMRTREIWAEKKRLAELGQATPPPEEEAQEGSVEA